MALAKRSLVGITAWLLVMASLGAAETMTGYSVDVIIQSVPAKYGDTMVAIPVYLQNNGFDTIAGYSLYITSGFPDLIDFVDVTDTAGTVSSGSCFKSFIVAGDTSIHEGDQVIVAAHNLEDTCAGYYIYPQTSGLLFTMHVNVAVDCSLMTDSILVDSFLIYAVSVFSNFSDKDGWTIPTPGQTSAESLHLNPGFIETPGTLIIGDVNGSCRGVTPCAPTLADIIHLVNYVFNKPPSGSWIPCPPAAADVNCSGTLSLADVISIVNYIFKGVPFSCP